MLVHALFVLLLQVQVPGVPEKRITNIFKPLAGPASEEKTIAVLTLAITGVIFVVVGALITYTIWRFRRKPGDDSQQEPPQVYGSNQIEVAWTVIPILIVFVLIGVSARVIASVENASPPKSMLKATIIGHQWWWEVHYPDYGIATANEIHVPVAGKEKTATYLQLQSQDVIHSFWVPQLAGKWDLVPNRTNYMWIDPQEPGVYLGNCAEYCGTQHANMLLRVIAQPKAEFQAWAASEQKPAVDNPQLTGAKAAFESLSCINCHTIKGTRALGKFGPDLTHLMSRQTLAAGMLTNTRDNLRAWVDDPQAIKPGSLMPSFKLNDKELDQVVAYLESLK
ncbi:MAG TPA: cytochrome c oxidase subunit II [Bryobacteraceae bacterium]